MHKKLTITLDEEVYRGLHKRVGAGRISGFIENLVRPHVVKPSIEDGYRAMAQDKQREKEAMEWCEGLIGDMDDETR